MQSHFGNLYKLWLKDAYIYNANNLLTWKVLNVNLSLLGTGSYQYGDSIRFLVKTVLNQFPAGCSPEAEHAKIILQELVHGRGLVGGFVDAYLMAIGNELGRELVYWLTRVDFPWLEHSSFLSPEDCFLDVESPRNLKLLHEALSKITPIVRDVFVEEEKCPRCNAFGLTFNFYNFCQTCDIRHVRGHVLDDLENRPEFFTILTNEKTLPYAMHLSGDEYAKMILEEAEKNEHSSHQDVAPCL